MPDDVRTGPARPPALRVIPVRRLVGGGAAPLLLLALAGCGGPQSALNAAGIETASLLRLFVVMVIGAAIIWSLLIGAAIAAILRDPGRHTDKAANALIIGGGICFPTIGLALLIVFGLSELPDWAESDADLRVHVHAEQFWWRVTYERGEEEVISANEVHLPAGETVEFVLTTADVIHSFWMPTIGGKMDMIPGRVNRIRLTATEPGTYRGACFEFCGASHALMAFAVVVHRPDEFDTWLAAQAEPAEPTEEALGRELFLASGCGACHRIEGVVELGAIGPDLTHFGSRLTLGAGTLPREPDAVAGWIARPEAFKPDVKMPAYSMLPETEIRAITAFLMALE